MDILPSALETCIRSFRPLLRAEVFDTFYYLLVGLLIGEAKFGAVRASVFAPPDYQPARISDFFTTHRVSPQALMAELTALSLRLLYGGKLPDRLFWIADSTQTEKPHAKKITALGLFHRSKWVIGRARHLQGHCYACAAHLYQYLDADGQTCWASLLCGALLYVKGRSIPALAGRLAGHLRLPSGLRHVWIADRGIRVAPLAPGARGTRPFRARARVLKSGRLLHPAPSAAEGTQENLWPEMPGRSIAPEVS